MAISTNVLTYPGNHEDIDQMMFRDPVAMLTYPSNSMAFYLAILFSAAVLLLDAYKGRIEGWPFIGALWHMTNIFFVLFFLGIIGFFPQTAFYYGTTLLVPVSIAIILWVFQLVTCFALSQMVKMTLKS